jgi:hypothetical protein
MLQFLVVRAKRGASKNGQFYVSMAIHFSFTYHNMPLNVARFSDLFILEQNTI